MELGGDGVTLLAELTCIVRGLRAVFDKEFAEAMIPVAVEYGMKTPLDEVEQELAS